MNFEFCVNDLDNFFLKNGYDWDKKMLINNEYKFATNEYLNNRDFESEPIKLILAQGLKKLNLTLNISPTTFVIKNCNDIYLGKLNIEKNDYSKDWCEHLILTYGNEFIEFFKKYNENFIINASKQYELEKQKIDDELNQLTLKTKAKLQKFNENQNLINKFYFKNKEKDM